MTRIALSQLTNCADQLTSVSYDQATEKAFEFSFFVGLRSLAINLGACSIDKDCL